MNVEPESKRRLELVLQIVDDWWGGLVPGDGSTDEEIAETERRLGVRLPSTMRYWYSVAGNLAIRAWCFGLPDTFFPVSDLWMPNHIYKVTEDYEPIPTTKRALNIAVENQGCWFACIKEEDLSLDDPPIRFNYDKQGDELWEFPGDGDGWIPRGISFSEFLLLEICLMVGWKGQYRSEGFPDQKIYSNLQSVSELVYSSEFVGDLYFGEFFLIWKYDILNDGRLVISIKTREVMDKIAEISSFSEIKWRHQHQDRYWGHSLTPECRDLILPYPENTFPECHLNSPWPRTTVTFHVDENGKRYSMH